MTLHPAIEEAIRDIRLLHGWLEEAEAQLHRHDPDPLEAARLLDEVTPRATSIAEGLRTEDDRGWDRRTSNSIRETR